MEQQTGTNAMLVARETENGRMAEFEHETLFKQEPLQWGETCTNVYDAFFDVVKHEVGDSSETAHGDDAPAAALACSTVHVETGPSGAKARLPLDTLNTGDWSLASCPAQTTKDDISCKTHSQTKHIHSKRLSCSICNYQCEYRSRLKSHMRTHTGEKSFVCNLCNFKCSQPSDLKTHIRTHTGERPFACKHCDYKFSRTSHLKRHIMTHTGEKPFTCSYCDYRCSTSSYLKIHIRTHIGEKPFICNLCNFQCSQVSNLKTHIRIHSGEKPFACNHCDFKCSRANNLKVHMKVHTGERFSHVTTVNTELHKEVVKWDT